MGYKRFWCTGSGLGAKPWHVDELGPTNFLGIAAVPVAPRIFFTSQGPRPKRPTHCTPYASRQILTPQGGWADGGIREHSASALHSCLTCRHKSSRSSPKLVASIMGCFISVIRRAACSFNLLRGTLRARTGSAAPKLK